MDDEFKAKLAEIRPDVDCVAVFKPNEGVWFHIPDAFIEQVKTGRNIPPYVMAVLFHAHLYANFETDQTIIDFVDQVKYQIMLDLVADADDQKH